MSQRDRFAKLKATKELPAPTPAPVDPTIDPVAQKIADRLMAQFSRPIATQNGAKLPPIVSLEIPEKLPPTSEAPNQTMSLSDREHTMLRNQKAAEDRATAAERKAEKLEQSITFVIEHLAAFTMRQQETLASTINGLLTPFQIEMAQIKLDVIRTTSQLALKLFIAWPAISTEALTNLDVSEEDVATWRKWYAAYKSQEHAVWLEKLADLQKHNASPMLPGQEQFFVAALQQDGVDVKRRLEEISAERLRRFEYEHPILVNPRSGSYER